MSTICKIAEYRIGMKIAHKVVVRKKNVARNKYKPIRCKHIRNSTRNFNSIELKVYFWMIDFIIFYVMFSNVD